MNTMLVDKTRDGFVATYLVGVNVKLAHEVMGAATEAELTGILTDEGVPKAQIAQALEELRRNERSTTITFAPKLTR